MAEVHIIGEIAEATGFEDGSLFAKWSLNAGSCWRALEGFTKGQTQLITKTLSTQIHHDHQQQHSECTNTEAAAYCHPWSHPIDVHYLTRGLQGWPRLELHIWAVDWLGKCNISAYGFLNVPPRPGYHELECHTWRPVGDLRRRLIDYVTGYRMHLVDPSDILSGGLNRHVIQSQSMGTVRVNLTVVMKDFQEFGVDV